MEEKIDGNKNITGIWIGIDLGTSNCTAAFWDTVRNRAKLIRFRSNVASRVAGKCGRILPSCISYDKNNGDVTAVGQGAQIRVEGQECFDDDSEKKGRREKNEAVFSSVKRIWGMTKTQIEAALLLDTQFLSSFPFSLTLAFSDDEAKSSMDGARLCIGGGPEPKSSAGNLQRQRLLIPPLQVATQFLETIRKEAEAYFRRDRSVFPLGAGCHTDGTLGKVRNVVIGVPAHFSRNRCQAIVDAARDAGFDGHVSTIIESTAASMAYGLNATFTTKHGGSKNILVFDMGGGTTDVTIAQMTQPKDAGSEPSFCVLATLGDRHLGGDDMDILLARFLSTQLLEHDGRDWTKLRQFSRKAKEELCGNGTPDCPRRQSISLTNNGKTYELHYDQFDILIKPLLERASSLVQSTLANCNVCNNNDSLPTIDEVILVGGATRTPSIPSMLHSIFPNVEFCTSIQGDRAVVEGAAIQSALQSGLVPRHVVRNAMMLDVLPHPIGVLIHPSEGKEEIYVPILERGMALPAMNFASFRLAALDQRGVTIIAVEDVGDDFELERLGEFTFLLHRLSEEELTCIEKERGGGCGGRMVDVGMTVETNGRFIVRIFDKNDPEHLKKKESYKEWKRRQTKGERNSDIPIGVLTTGGSETISKTSGRSWEEITLTFACVMIFGLYILMKALFYELEEETFTR